MVHVEVSLLVFIDVDLEVAMITLGCGCHDQRISLADGIVFLFLLAIRELSWILISVITITTFVVIIVVILHHFIIVGTAWQRLPRLFGLELGKFRSEDGAIVYLRVDIVAVICINTLIIFHVLFKGLCYLSDVFSSYVLITMTRQLLVIIRTERLIRTYPASFF